MLLFYISVLLFVCFVSHSISDAQEIQTLSTQGKIVVLHPPPPNNGLSVISQPFSVIISVELMMGVDYADWKHCYSIVDSGFVDYCALIMINDGTIQFSPILGMGPPEFDLLDPSVSHRLITWFESVSRPETDKWGIESFEFKVTRSSVRTSHGGYRYLGDEPISRQSYSISGLIVEPRDHHNIPIAIRNVFESLKIVRPIHLFHGMSYDPCEADQFLCDLIRDEVLVPHRLLINNLSFMDYNRLLLDEALWSHIHSEKVLVFQTDTAVCSLTSKKLVQDFSHCDYVGAHQVVSYWIESPPVLVEEELLGGNGGFSLRDVNLSKLCVKEKKKLGLGRDQEDVFFPNCIAEKGGVVADVGLQRQFATYQKPVGRECSLGAHKIDVSSTAGLEFINECCPDYGLLRE